MKLYAIRDKVAGSIIGNIVTHKADAAAARQFADLCAQRDTIVGTHPADFELLHIADVDEDTGKVTCEGVFGYPLPRVVVAGSSYDPNTTEGTK